MKDRVSLFNKAAILRERGREGEGMRNVLIPQGSEQTANEGPGGGGRQREDREEKLETRRGRKQDLQPSCLRSCFGSRNHHLTARRGSSQLIKGCTFLQNLWRIVPTWESIHGISIKEAT